MDLQWPRALNQILTNRWTHLKNTLVLKDFVDHLIQKRVVTLDYWIGLKSKPITESERTEDFLSLVMKFNREKYSLFLEALLETGHLDLVKVLAVDIDGKSKKIRTKFRGHTHGNTSEKQESAKAPGQTDADLDDIYSTPLAKKDGGDKPKPKPREHVTKDEVTKDEVKENSDGTQKDQSKLEKPSQVDKQNPSKSEIGNTQAKRGHKTDDTKGHDEQVNEKQTSYSKTSDLKTELRFESAKSKEEILEEREQNIINRETELSKKEKELEEKDRSLQEMETSLVILERSLVLNETLNSGPASLTKDIQVLNFGQFNSPAASSTQSSDYLAEVRDQIRELRKGKGEIEDETSFGPTPKPPKDDYVKMKDLEIVQEDIADIKEGIASERYGRESLQKQFEEQKHTVENLTSKIVTLETEKEAHEKDFNKKVTKLKADLKNIRSSHAENMNKVREEIRIKEEECKLLKSEVGILKKNADDLENRVNVLETDKTWAEKELKRMEQKVSNLKHKLTEKEGELSDLRKILEDTETERDNLIDEVTELKNELVKLRSDKRRLEQEKKTLLQRCVKPGWNQNTRTSSFK